MNITTKALTDYLECAKIYKGASSKKKTDLIEMIVYGHITNEINKMNHVDISKNECSQILKQNKINVRSLPWYGNVSRKKKEIVPSSISGECAIRISEWIVS